MAWWIGIDEAGYGPNLGPFIQVMAGIHSPEDAAPEAGTSTGKQWFRRSRERDRSRALLDDSKRIHAGPQGLIKLEAALADILGWSEPVPLGKILEDWLLPGCAERLEQEFWYQPAASVPQSPGKTSDFLQRFHAAGWQAKILAVNIVPTRWFNEIVTGSGTKGTIPTAGVSSLLAALKHVVPGYEPIQIRIDQLGGRHHYSGVVQAGFPDGWVVTESESAQGSRYRIESWGRGCQVCFQPRADAAAYETALASMLAKYLRERLMQQFNRYWQQFLPELPPTAGYPVDAKRFFAAIEPLLPQCQLTRDDVWRAK